MKFGWEIIKQVTHGSISTNLPQFIDDLHALMLMGFCFCFWRLKVFIFAFEKVEGFCYWF
jgi:uncharacterized membrane protein YGL010W